jgi:hypothetical protein
MKVCCLARVPILLSAGPMQRAHSRHLTWVNAGRTLGTMMILLA